MLNTARILTFCTLLLINAKIIKDEKRRITYKTDRILKLNGLFFILTISLFII